MIADLAWRLGFQWNARIVLFVMKDE